MKTFIVPLDPADLIAALWVRARAWMNVLVKRFGGPVGIAAARATRSLNAIKRRLAALDLLLLKLLLTEAARLASPPLAPRSTPAVATGPRRAAPHEDANDPETWQVRYRPRLPRLPRARAGAGGQPVAAGPPRSAATRARALARRCEALRRVLAQPRAAIASLARKLRALGAAARAMGRAIAWAPPPRGALERMVLAHATVCANDFSALLADTS